MNPDDIEVPEDEAGSSFNLPPIGEPDPEPKAAEPTELEKRLTALEAERQQDRERYEGMLAQSQSTIDRLLQGLPVQQAPQPSAGYEALPELPDPVEKPDEFKKAVADLVRRQATEMSNTLSQHSTSQQRIADLRTRFWETNQDLKDYPEFVESAYAKEAGRLQAIGVDPQTALLRDPDGLSARVAQLARERVQALGLGRKGEPESKGKGRTAGVSGGTTPTAPKTAFLNGEQAPVGFVSELKRQQAESGYF